MSQVLTTSSAAVTTTSSFYIIPMTGSAFSFDNFQFVSDSESTTTAYTYDAANELLTMASGGSSTAFTYDDWGRTVSKTMSGHTAVTGWRRGTLRSYTTDFPDETSMAYNYDGLDKRRNKLVGSDLKWYRWNTGYNVIAEYGGTNGSWTFGTQTMTYMPGLAEITGADATTGTYRYYSEDHLGSIRRIRDNSMASLATYEYEPYGDEFAVSGLALNKGFTGHTYEPETGMYFAPYRYYDTDASRWISRDPLGMVDGPNEYAYVRENPIVKRDPLGLTFETCMMDCLSFEGGCLPGWGACAGVAAAAIACAMFPPSCPAIVGSLSLFCGGIVLASGAVCAVKCLGKDKWDGPICGQPYKPCPDDEGEPDGDSPRESLRMKT